MSYAELQVRHGHERFIGRIEELHQLDRLLSASTKEPAAGLVEGPAGVGKTALVDEFLRRLPVSGIQAARGRCYEESEAGPYFPFRQVARQLDQTAADPLTAVLSSALSEIREFREADQLSDQRARFFNRLTDALIARVAAKPLILVIEDLHWADTASLLLINNLIDIAPSKLCVLCTTRTDEEVKPDTATLISQIERKSAHIRLRGMASDEIHELAQELLGPGSITAKEADRLHLLTEGNPLFSRELLLHLQDRGLLQNHSVLDALRRSQTPSRLSRMIDSRLGSLPKTTRNLLGLAAVIGARFTTKLLADVAGSSEGDIEKQLQLPLSRRILEITEGIEGPGFEFCHPLHRLRLYELLSIQDRRRAHRMVAERLSGTSLVDPEQLALHYARGASSRGDAAALSHCQSAAERCEQLFAYESAAEFWRLAATFVDPKEQRPNAEVYQRLGRALWAAGNWAAAGEALERSAALCEYLEDGRDEAELAASLAEVYRWLQSLPEAKYWANRALDSGKLANKKRAVVLALLGSIHCLCDEPEEGVPLLRRADRLARPAEPVVRYWLSYGLLTAGEWSEAARVARSGLHLARRRHDRRARRLLATSMVHHELTRLDIDSARAHAQIVTENVEQGDAVAQTYDLIARSVIGAYEGDWTRVVALCERWMSQARLVGDYYTATARMHWALALLARGDAEQAELGIVASLPHLERMQPLGELHLAQALVELGRHDEAALLVKKRFDQAAASRRSGSGRLVLADVACSIEDADLWNRCYSLVRDEDRPMVVVYTPVSVQRVLGRLATRLELWNEAEAHLRLAVAQLERGRAMWELAYSHISLAELWAARRRRGDRVRAESAELEATAIFRELGVEPPAEVRSTPSRNGNRFALSAREVEVLGWVARGLRNPEIAEALTISRRTVERHVENILNKMAANGRTEAVVKAVQEGLLGDLDNAKVDSQPGNGGKPDAISRASASRQ